MPHPAASAPCASLCQPPPATQGGGKIATAAWMVTAAFILSNSATPLYVHWQKQFAFSSATLTVIFAAYIVGLLGSLLVAGQLSDRLGRKAVLVPAFLVAMAACGLFGMAASVATADRGTFPDRGCGRRGRLGRHGGGGGRRRATAETPGIAGGVDCDGAGRGTGASAGGHAGASNGDAGLDAVRHRIRVAGDSLAGGRHPSLSGLPGGSGAVPAQRLRLPSVPKQNRMDLALGIAVFAPGLSATSFMLVLGPALLSQQLQVNSPLLAGGTACLMFMCGAGVQFAVKQLPTRTVLLLSAAATGLSMAAMIAAIHIEAPALLLAAAGLAGMGQGLGQLGGLTTIAINVPDQQRAQANSLLNIGAYIPAGFLPVATGFLIDRAGLAQGATTFAVALIAAAIAAAGFVASRQSHTDLVG